MSTHILLAEKAPLGGHEGIIKGQGRVLNIIQVADMMACSFDTQDRTPERRRKDVGF